MSSHHAARYGDRGERDAGDVRSEQVTHAVTAGREPPASREAAKRDGPGQSGDHDDHHRRQRSVETAERIVVQHVSQYQGRCHGRQSDDPVPGHARGHRNRTADGRRPPTPRRRHARHPRPWACNPVGAQGPIGHPMIGHRGQLTRRAPQRRSRRTWGLREGRRRRLSHVGYQSRRRRWVTQTGEVTPPSSGIWVGARRVGDAGSASRQTSRPPS